MRDTPAIYRKFGDLINVPKWLEHHAFFSAQNIDHPYLRLFAGYFDVHPRRLLKKVNLYITSAPPFIGHIHIPKTGGTYTNSVLRGGASSFLNFSHGLIRSERSDRFCPIGLVPLNKNKVKRFYLFSNVRNPLTFLISYYNHAGGLTPRYRNTNHYDYKPAQKGFDYLINTILDRTDKWPSRKFLYPQLFNQDGRCIVNWINRTENLNQDLKSLSQKLDFDFELEEPKRESKREKSYRDFYTPELLERVSKAYKREMRLFGYEGFKNKETEFQIKPLEKERLEYNYQLDKLFIDDEEFQR